MATFITPVNNPNTILADGETVDISNWLVNFDTIYNYVNTFLVAQFNLMNNPGDLITNNGSAIAVLSTSGIPDGNVLVKRSTAASGLGIDWETPPGIPINTNGDLLYYNSGDQRLGIGTAGQILTVVSGLPSWQNAIGTPSGVIAMWVGNGTLTDIPTGWVLCNGLNGTPNLQGLFVVGAGNQSPPAAGGMGLMNPGGPFGDTSAGAGLGPQETTGPASQQVFVNGTSGTVSVTPNTHTHGVTVTPRYFALAFIMKT
jgi:hypothetical protein